MTYFKIKVFTGAAIALLGFGSILYWEFPLAASGASSSPNQPSKTLGETFSPNLTLKGHSDSVWAVAISPDGKMLASVSTDKTIKLWNLATGQELRTLKGHSDWVNSVAFSPDGKTLASGSSDKTVKLKLYRLVYLPNENRWGDQLIEAVPFNDREYSVGHAALTADGQTLYFASDKPGGYGGVDIYKSVRDQSGNWAAPTNLGPSINTSGDEMFPFVSNDGTLYFSSNGHLGLGGLDVFSATAVSTKEGWSAPENLGFPINTNSDDFGYIIDKENKNGYFVSNRAGGKGDDDIYKFV